MWAPLASLESSFLVYCLLLAPPAVSPLGACSPLTSSDAVHSTCTGFCIFNVEIQSFFSLILLFPHAFSAICNTINPFFFSDAICLGFCHHVWLSPVTKYCYLQIFDMFSQYERSFIEPFPSPATGHSYSDHSA